MDFFFLDSAKVDETNLVMVTNTIIATNNIRSALKYFIKNFANRPIDELFGVLTQGVEVGYDIGHIKKAVPHFWKTAFLLKTPAAGFEPATK